MTIRLVLKRGMYIPFSFNRQMRMWTVLHIYGAGGRRVKKGWRGDSYIFMVTTKHDDIL